MSKIPIALFSIFFLTACTFSLNSASFSKIKTPSDLPNRIELKDKITKFYEAEVNGDWSTSYSLTSRQFKKHCPLEKYLKMSNAAKEFRIVSWSIKDIKRILPTGKDEKELNEYAVEVEMDIFFKIKNNWWSKSIRYNDQKKWIDCWIYEDNSWSWLVRNNMF